MARATWRERLNEAARALRGRRPVSRPLARPSQPVRPLTPLPSSGQTRASAEAAAPFPLGGIATPGAAAPPVTTNKDTGGSMTNPPALAGGRQTLPTNVNPFGLGSFSFIYRREYQALDLASIDTSQFEAGQLLTLLADLNPDVSLALWNVLRVSGTDLTFKVTTVGGADDARGQALLEAVVGRLNRRQGGFPALVVQLLSSAFIQGAVALDIAPTDALDDVEDIFAVNPNTIWFQRDENQVPVPFQKQQWAWGSGVLPYRRLNQELFGYTPIDAYVDDVYGRPPAAPVLQNVFFQAQVYRDLQRVIHAQGWPKIDISLLMEVILNVAPQDVRQDPDQFALFVQARLDDIIGAYNSMNPDDAYVHPDYVAVNSTNAAAGGQLFDVSKLLAAIRMQVIAGCKTLPVLMGEHVGSTETYAQVELNIYAATIDVFREAAGNALAWALGVSLQLLGHAALVAPVWAPVEIHNRLVQAQAIAQEQANWAYRRDQGWVSQDQASEAITGSKAVSPTPIAPQGSVPDQKPAAPAGPPATP